MIAIAPVGLFTNGGTAGAPLLPAPARTVIGPSFSRDARVDAFRSTGVLRLTIEDVRDWQRHILDVGTQVAVPADLIRRPSPTNFSGAIWDLRRHSGLRWQELADALSVSRRAVHHWAKGGHVSAVHAQLIQDLATLVAQYEETAPDATRARLLAPTQTGPAPLAAFRARSGPRRSVPLSTLSVADLLSDEPLEEPPPTQPPGRRSRLAPRPLGPGRSSNA
jgi:hypothetical protein